MVVMKEVVKIFSVIYFFFFIPAVYADGNITNETTTAVSLNYLKWIYSLLVSFNPFLLLFFGIILLLAAKIAKYVAIFLIIFSLIQILLLII